MVVDDFDIVSVATFPLEDYSPLVVDPDGMEASPFSHQSFQPVAGGISQIFKRPGTSSRLRTTGQPGGVSRPTRSMRIAATPAPWAPSTSSS